MRLVIALGGNALLRPDQPLTAAAQRDNVRIAAASIAEITRNHQVVLTHGNGPQVGLLAESANGEAWPLDVLTAETEGMIGYVLQQELEHRLDGPVATLLTQVVVDPNDPAFQNPSKPIGRVYDAVSIERFKKDRRWSAARYGSGFRRVVPSPMPREIREITAIRTLVDSGIPVICAGGGGIPVVAADTGALSGVEAVIDKDHTSALIARELGADALLILTDVPAVYTGWEMPMKRAIKRATPKGLEGYQFAAGSMAPKIAAACSFVKATRGFSAIGALGEAEALLGGHAGTLISSDGPDLVWYD
ncbi:MAG: carbamate kinase [Alphaproteobacteria bacterium]